MKKGIFIIILAIIAFACGEDFLTESPHNSINTENFYQTEEDAIAAINGAYQPLQWPKLYNFRMWTTDIWPSDAIVGAGGGEDGRDTKDIASQVTTTNNPALLDIMRGPSPGILRCNYLLYKLPGMNINNDLKNRIEGEAKFLRSLYYFILVRVFGDVPLLTKPQFPGDDLFPARTDKKIIYEQIVKDLEDAINLLPTKKSYSSTDLGRATKGSALALLAKVHLTLGNFDKVPILCQQVTDLGYALNANYKDNFSIATENSIESIFEIQYVAGAGKGFWNDENQSSWVSCFMGPRNSGMVSGGWGWMQPTQEFVDSYEPGDLRKDVTILYKGCPDFGGKAYDPAYSTTGYSTRKFLVTKAEAPTYDSNPLNFPVLRYADVLLMHAEALNELGKTAEAEPLLNQVRARAGLPALTGLTKSGAKEKIIHERRMELAFEGHRWFDIIRIDDGQYALDFLHSIGKVNATRKHLLMPIPQQEMDANRNLVQNPGY